MPEDPKPAAIKVVKLSSQGQFTVPKKWRELPIFSDDREVLVELYDDKIVLRAPIASRRVAPTSTIEEK